MNRRGFLKNVLLGAAAVLGIAPMKTVEGTGYGPFATWYLEQSRRGEWLIIDQQSGDVYTGAPSDEMLDALASARWLSHAPNAYASFDDHPPSVGALPHIAGECADCDRYR